MKKTLLIITSLLTLFLNISIMDAKIEYTDLTDTLKKENIDILYGDVSKDSNSIVVHYFYNTGETSSLSFLNFVNENYDEYGDLFEVRCYEVSDNLDNYQFMNNIVDYMKEGYTEAPFIVINETYFVSFDESVQENFIKAVQTNYLLSPDERRPIVDEVRNRYYRNDTLMVGITFGLLFVLIFGIIYAIVSNKKEA